jgi:hypothetical protein
MVKTETHRGLEGRALAGFWTGGRVYGYAVVKEQNPPDPEHPRSLLVIDKREAEVVRRIFSRYVDGHGFKRIAADLNSDGVPAPYDRTVAKKRGRGWQGTTIRAMLLNERHIGRFTWNRRKHVRVAGRAHRRAINRPRSEWKTLNQPELAIIDATLWSQVQARFQGRRQKRAGRSPGSVNKGRRPHLLTGIAKCGNCGAGMHVVGSRKKKGITYVQLGCSGHWTRGASICPNGRTISEKKLNEAVLGALRETLLEPGVLKRFVDRFQAKLGQAHRQKKADNSIERELLETENRIRNLTDAPGTHGLQRSRRHGSP